MLFNSVDFAIFLPIVFILYWFATKGNLKLQNILLLVSSYFFYACWDWRFMFLLIFSTLLDYFTGIKIHESINKKKKLFWLWLSIGINLGFLGIFKYYNFFAESFANALELIGLNANLGSLQVILPVGISFYTFHGLSYVFDIYNNKIKPELNFTNYSVFVCFFPLLVAGPIERATHLLPQIIKKREFNYSKAVDGLRQILWGLFKKIVIADSCAEYANAIFNNSADYSGSMLVVGALFFTFQIYCDFSGYTDIALGTARLFGIELLRNFAFPYFSRDIAEFWRRWHISLSSWFRDYLYIPLGGSKGGMWMKVRNTFIIFLVSGFWHGANWTFVVWGALNAIYFLPLLLFETNRKNTNIIAENSFLPSIRELFGLVITFTLVVIAWIFFRAENLTHAFNYLYTMLVTNFMAHPAQILLIPVQFFSYGVSWFILILIGVEWLQRKKKHGLEFSEINIQPAVRWATYFIILAVIGWFMFDTKPQQFIYFQF